MNIRGIFRSALSSLAVTFLPELLCADDLVFAKHGQAMIAIHAPGENEWAGRRLADRLFKYTGARAEVHTGEIPPPVPSSLVVIGTPQSNLVVKDVAGTDERIEGLGDEGYLLKNASWQQRAVLVAVVRPDQKPGRDPVVAVPPKEGTDMGLRRIEVGASHEPRGDGHGRTLDPGQPTFPQTVSP